MTSSAAMTLGTSRRQPSRRKLSRRPSAAARRSTSPRSSPSPARTKTVPGSSRTTRAATSTNVSGDFCGLRQAIMPTRGAFRGTPISSRNVGPAPRDPPIPAARSNSARRTPLRIRLTRSRVNRPSATPVSRLARDTAMKRVVSRATRPSRAMKARRTGQRCDSWNPKPWMVCTTRGTPARRAASRPRTPAFEECVWTMSGLSFRKRRARLRSARASRWGRTGRTSEGTNRSGTPRRRASPSRAPPRPHTRLGTKDASRCDTVYSVLSCAPPGSSSVIT